MILASNEFEIIGKWILVDGNLEPDSNAKRIDELINNYLKKISTDDSEWNILYQDPRDNRFWELSYPESERHGGGPPTLKCIDKIGLKHRYFSGMMLNERLYHSGLIDKFDEALEKRDEEKITIILTELIVKKSSIKKTLKDLGFSN